MTLLPLTARTISGKIKKKEEEPLKKFYEEPKLTAETFAVEDIITASGDPTNTPEWGGTGGGDD